MGGRYLLRGTRSTEHTREGGDGVSTCMGCLEDFEDADLVWENGLVCTDCDEGGEDGE